MAWEGETGLQIIFVKYASYETIQNKTKIPDISSPPLAPSSLASINNIKLGRELDNHNIMLQLLARFMPLKLVNRISNIHCWS